MKLLFFLADSFIAAFGITRPTDKTRQQAAVFICVLMLLVVTLIVASAIVIHESTR